ncbi:hypothetical protein NHP164001_20910 [Helicobacter trogontum]|uniref:Uncharacterized protein n=1 Tax=Helicobacter trogontum TaxID=50960 RepID=A0ABQ0D6T5_9HELI
MNKGLLCAMVLDMLYLVAFMRVYVYLCVVLCCILYAFTL